MLLPRPAHRRLRRVTIHVTDLRRQLSLASQQSLDLRPLRAEIVVVVVVAVWYFVLSPAASRSTVSFRLSAASQASASLATDCSRGPRVGCQLSHGTNERLRRSIKAKSRRRPPVEMARNFEIFGSWNISKKLIF